MEVSRVIYAAVKISSNGDREESTNLNLDESLRGGEISNARYMESARETSGRNKSQ